MALHLGISQWMNLLWSLRLVLNSLLSIREEDGWKDRLSAGEVVTAEGEQKSLGK